MMNQKIIHFNSIVDLQESINEQIKDLDDKIGLHSKLIGDKIREGEKNNSEELTDLKNKLNPEKNKEKKGEDKKSKTKKTAPKKKLKKGESENWISFENISLYNGVGTRGELELYFKSLEEMKEESERLKKTKESLEKLLNSGIKKDLAGIGFSQPDGPFELAFIKSDFKREKFSFKSILTVGCEC